MVVTDDDALAARVRRLKDLAHSPSRRFWHEELGFNYRMTNLQAALGVGQLAHIGEFLAKKRWMAEEYARQLQGVPGLHLPATKAWAENVHWMYAVLLDDRFPLSRDAFRAALRERDIDTRDFFSSSAQQPVIRRLAPPQGPFPVSEHIAARGLYLPSGLALTAEQIHCVCDAIRAIVRSA